jgi:hypothetical protein
MVPGRDRTPTAPRVDSRPISWRHSHRKFCAPPGRWKPTRSAPVRDVQEEADAQVRSQFAQHRRHELELVVLDPDGRARRGDVGAGLREPAVHLDVAVPPGPVEHRALDDVVVERPERRVGETFVVVADFVGAQRNRVQHEPVVVELLHVDVGDARPADPGALSRAQERLQGGDEPARAGRPAAFAVRRAFEVHRKPVRHHDEIGLIPVLLLVTHSCCSSRPGSRPQSETLSRER